MLTDELVPFFEEIAPSSLAESWDNVGWQIRIPGLPVTGILLAMDVTPGTLAEALHLGCNVIFAHHPLMFKPLSSLDLGTHRGSLIADLVRGNLSVWAAHTNLDVVPTGTSYALARTLGVQSPAVLSRIEGKEYKLVVYVPSTHVEQVKDAMAGAGAGRIGNYTHCFWQVLGTGQFKPEPGANPHLGSVGEEERVEEFRVEGVVPAHSLGAVLEAMRRSHPYEEVAYDLLPLANRVGGEGFGAVGDLSTPTTTEEMARLAAEKLGSVVVQVAGDPDRPHHRVAVVGGSGSSFMGDTLRSGATLFITADVRYHDVQDAVARGMDLVILDHYATERPVLDLVHSQMEKRLLGIPILVATTSTSPYVRVSP